MVRCLLISLLLAAASFGQTYPTELWPSSSEVTALNNTIDSQTGLPYIALGASPSSNPPLITQIDRRNQRTNAILAIANQGRVVKTAALRIGVFPLDYVLGGTRKTFAGATDQGNGSLTLGDDTYYVYLDNGNALQIVTDAADWPADASQFVPLAEVEVASNVVASITDRRNWASVVIPQTGGSAIDGTDAVFFILDQDNAGAGASSELRANRGSTAADDAALRWDETNDLWAALINRASDVYAPFRALTLESTATTGTAPLTVASTTKVANLNADAVDGVSVGTVAAAGGIVYATSTSALAGTAAGTSGQVLLSGGSGAPTWSTIGSTSGDVQAWDADLDSLAGLAAAGFIARDAGGTAAVRTLTAGTGISVTSGDGSGDPVISTSGFTENAVAVGNATGSLVSTSAGTDNTVLVGRTGNTPTFRKIVNADIDVSANLDGAKINSGSIPIGSLSAGAIGNTGKIPYRGETDVEWMRLREVHASPSGPVGAESYWDGHVLTNEGATSQVVIELQAAVAGRSYSVIVQDADGVRIQAYSGDTIRVAGTASSAAGYIEASTIGNAVTLVAVNSTEWIALSYVGTWTFGP